MREIVRYCFEDAARDRLREALRNAIGQRMQGGGLGAMRMAAAAGPWNLAGDGLSMVESLREQIHDAIRDRFSEAVRERVGSAIRLQMDDVLRERLGTVIRAALMEQKTLGGFDPDQFADSVRGRLGHAIRERLTDAIRERLHEVHRDRLRDAIRSAVSQRQVEFTGFGTGTH
jgi:hypothetical protein